jgi:glyoxylase-like metal-dependent hydrolase (beta-lactamase superfamily II)
MPFGENTYVAHFNDRSDCLVVDPGFEPGKIVRYLDDIGKDPVAFLLTHGHSDHIAGLTDLKARWPVVPVIIGAGDADKLTDPEKNLSAVYGESLVAPAADRLVSDGDRIEEAGFELEVYETPGHSVGHVIYVYRGRDGIRVFGGDVLFQNSVGRTDFPDGSFETLRRAIHEKIFSLPADALVLPGHGPPTTVGRERETNPFVHL